MISIPKILFLGTEDDRPYLYNLKGYAERYSMHQHSFIEEIKLQYGSKGITHIITTQPKLIPLLCSTASTKEQTLDNYAGSYLLHEKTGLYFLFIHPLKQLVTVTYGKFLFERYISKITKPSRWVSHDKFNWRILEIPDDYEQAWDCITHESSILCAVDIETGPDLRITSCSYTVVQKQSNTTYTTQTFVVPLPLGLIEDDYHFRYYWLKKFNQTPIQKILQNGKYDSAYFARYGIPLFNWAWDTQYCHHAYQSELPKALDIIATFYVRQSVFWKNEGDSGNLYDLYYYNALDTWHTAWVFLQWIAEVPDWVHHNYLLSYRTIAPNFVCEMTGLLVNYDKFYEVQKEQQEIKHSALTDLHKCVGTDKYNPGSSQQNLRLLKILGCSEIKNADSKVMNRVKHQHPFIALLVGKILKYKKAEKLVGTYLNEAKHFAGRVLYSLNPTTDTSRNKSKGHHFWCGFNIQNIPRKGGIKAYIVPDPEFMLYEADYAQAESRDTGYITGDQVLIDNVESDKDFHKSNASMFFGVPYEEVDKELRQLGKPVNHGANYMMAEDTLIDSMELENVFKAQKRLGLPAFWQPKQVTKHLLSLFANVYKVVSKDYPQWIKTQVTTFGFLVNPYGWRRNCYGDPVKSKQTLRSLVAHLPQSTNAQALNYAMRLVFDRVWKPNHENFKLNAQIHDSILHQCRVGYEYLSEEVKACMEEASTVEVVDIKGKKRLLKVPVDLSKGGTSWEDSKD